MKKIAILLSLCAVLFSATSFVLAAAPSIAPQAEFGPEILGLRLGKQMSWNGMIHAEEKINNTRPSAEPPEIIELPNGLRAPARAEFIPPCIFGMTIATHHEAINEERRTKIPGKWIKLHFFDTAPVKILSGGGGILSKVPKDGKLDVLFAILQKYDMRYAATNHVKTHEGRIIAYSLDKTNFPTKAATAEEFAHWLSAEYPLGTLEKKGRFFESRNIGEGWGVRVTEEDVQFFSLSAPKARKQ